MTEVENGAVIDAVDRALSRQRTEAIREVDAILDATLRVAERVAPASPRVADIVAEARSSNQAFYRYFSGKEDLMRAVMARGLERLHSYLEHQMSKASSPTEKIAAWIEGMFTQVTDEEANRQSGAINLQLSHARGGSKDGVAGLERLGTLLVAPLRDAGSTAPELDARALHDVVQGVVRRHAFAGTVPSRDELEHVLVFCGQGLGLTLAL
jgi:AcrR family transcriptional regulator